jgi:hypothetical protein
VAWARVAVADENWAPLQQVDVECFDVDTKQPISVVRSDGGGIALFTDLPENQRYFFKARTTRVSTGVGGRTYIGQVRLQILNVSSGITCYDVVVDPNEHGAYTTIQAAIDAYAPPVGVNRPWYIAIIPATYNENLVFRSTRRYALHGCAQTMSSPYGSQGELNANRDPIHVGGVNIKGTITMSGGGEGELNLRGIEIDTDTAAWTISVNYMVLRLENCYVGSGTTGAITGGVNAGIEIINSQVGSDDALKSVGLGLGASCVAINSVFRGFFDGSSQLGVRLSDCVVRAKRAADYVVKLGTLGMTSECRFAVLNCYIEQTDATGHGIHLYGFSTTSEEWGYQIENNFIDGANGGTAVKCDSGLDGAIIIGNIFHDWDTGINASGAPNVIAWPNLYVDVTTPTTGGGGSGTVLSPSHTLLDGNIHTDTIADPATAGDLIYANATPKWQSLAISIPAAGIRNVLGVDSTDTLPSWKAALDATNPADIAATASPGTSLIFSHRDHVHAHPVFPSGDLHPEYLTQAEADALYALISHTHAHADLTGVTPDQHHAGFVGFTIPGPANIDPDANDRITFVDSASVTWSSPGAGQIQATASGGGPHNLLDGSVHPDTLAGTVAAGDLVVGNATPKWARLAKGPAGYVLKAGVSTLEWGRLAYADLSDDPLATYLLRALSVQTLVATDDIEVTDSTPYTPIQSASAITLTSQPTIAAGRNGQIAYIANVGNYNITVQDVNVLGGSLLRLTANTVTIQPGGTLVMRYDSAVGFWMEVSVLNPQSFTPSISSFTMDGFSSATHEVGGANSPESPSTHNFALTYVGTPSSCSIDIDGGEINPSDYPVTLVSPYTSYSNAPNFYRATTIGGTRILTASAMVSGQPKTKTVTVTYYNSRYAGINTQATLLSSAQVVALGALAIDNSYNSGSKSGLAATGLNYIWYCYRSALGTANLYFGVNWKGDGTERASFTQIGSQSVTNASGFVESFYEYRSAIQGINSLPGAQGTSTLYLASSAYNNRIYMGPDASTDPIPTANIRALDDTASGTSKIASSVAGSYTITIGSGKYLWFCHPASIPDLATIKDHSTGFAVAGSYRTNVSHTNDLGYVETYRCWRSDNQGIFPSGGTVDVT